MAWLRQRVLLTASVFLVLGLMEPVTADTGQASFYTAPYTPNMKFNEQSFLVANQIVRRGSVAPVYIASACYGYDTSQIPADMLFAAGGDSASANIWNNGANCGKYYRIQCVGNGCNGSGPINVKIIEKCPNGCVGGRAFDLSETAFSTIADLNVGVITVEYSLASSRHDDQDAANWTKEKLIAKVGHGGQ